MRVRRRMGEGPGVISPQLPGAMSTSGPPPVESSSVPTQEVPARTTTASCVRSNMMGPAYATIAPGGRGSQVAGTSWEDRGRHADPGLQLKPLVHTDLGGN